MSWIYIAQLIVPLAEILDPRRQRSETPGNHQRDHQRMLDQRYPFRQSWSWFSPAARLQPWIQERYVQPRTAFIIIGNPPVDFSLIAATYNMYLPFLASEIIASEIKYIADRQNALSQTVALRGLMTLFQLVGRENEFHRQTCGFSISHSDVDVRI
jgi:hypothetical protein